MTFLSDMISAETRTITPKYYGSSHLTVEATKYIISDNQSHDAGKNLFKMAAGESRDGRKL